jgi:hypothetical protein
MQHASRVQEQTALVTLEADGSIDQKKRHIIVMSLGKTRPFQQLITTCLVPQLNGLD